MDDDHLEVILDDEPELPKNDTLVITNEDLADVVEPAAHPGFHSPANAPYAPGSPGGAMQLPAKGASPVAQALGSALWQSVIAGAFGGFLAWAILEPLTNDNEISRSAGEMLLAMGLFGGGIGACVGTALGAVDGLFSQVYQKALIAGLLGLGIGFVGGFLGGVFGQCVYGALGGGHLTLPLQIFTRTIGWAAVGFFVGLGQGVAIRSKRKIINGLLGGLIGGAIGGFLFDPISTLVGGGAASRAIAITVLGACTGLAIGMVEEYTKQAWLLITGGPLAGKEFILYHSFTSVGSSPQCEITVPKDPGIQPRHYSIQTTTGGNELRAEAPTLLNGRPVNSARLRDGDQIQTGNTLYTYSERVQCANESG
jgi:hypothetical protein